MTESDTLSIGFAGPRFQIGDRVVIETGWEHPHRLEGQAGTIDRPSHNPMYAYHWVVVLDNGAQTSECENHLRFEHAG
jgi:hypothetical protein